MRKFIIDTDPGVDDATSLIIAMNNQNFDIKLITTTYGNVDIEKTTKNALFLVEKFGKDIKVAKGSEKPMKRKQKSTTASRATENTIALTRHDALKLSQPAFAACCSFCFMSFMSTIAIMSCTSLHVKSLEINYLTFQLLPAADMQL